MNAPSVAATALKIAIAFVACVAIGVGLAAMGAPAGIMAVPAVVVIVPIWMRDRNLRRLAAGTGLQSTSVGPSFGASLPALRIADKPRTAQFKFERDTRAVWANGALRLSGDKARFDAIDSSRSWTPTASPSSIVLRKSRPFPGTAVRVTCGNEAAQFFVEQPVAEVRAALAPHVPAQLIETG